MIIEHNNSRIIYNKYTFFCIIMVGDIMKQSVKVAVSGVTAALSVALMFCSSLFYVFTYVVPMILGVLIIMVKKTFSCSSAWFVFISSSLISFIIVPDKEAVLMYTLFFGYYPIIKSYIEHIKIKPLRVVLKFLVFNAAITLVELIAYFLFGIPFFEDGNFSAAMIILFAVLMNVVFILYDLLLKNFLVLYEKRIEKRIRDIFKV